MTQDLLVLFLREIDALRREVDLYPTDAALWKEHPGLPNSGGTLVMHLAGNLRHFIGGVLGRSAYVRDRNEEFSRRDVPKAELLGLIAAARREVAAALDDLQPGRLAAPFDGLPVQDRTMTTNLFLLHLLSHLGYHLGQIDYHRRVTTGDPVSAKTLPLSGLGTPTG